VIIHIFTKLGSIKNLFRVSCVLGTGHQGNVYSLSWSLSGGSAKEKLFLASCSSDCSVKIWSPDTGQAVQTLIGHKSAVVRVIWQPDSTFTVASASLDNTIRLWNGFSGQVLHVLMVEDNGSPCIGLSFYKIKNSNPVLISVSRGGQVILWNALTGTCIAKRQNSCNLTAFNASRDGRRLACGQDDGRIIVLDTDTLLTKPAIIEPSHGRVEEVEVGTEVIAILSTEKVSDRSVASLTFSFDGRSLLAAYSSASNLPIEVSHQDPPTIPIIIDGTSTATTTTTTARTSKGHIMDCKTMINQWEISSGNHLGCYDNQGSTAAGVDVAAIQMSPDGKQFVSCYANGCMSVWNYFKVPPLYKGPPLRHLSPVRFVSWLPVAFCEDRNRWTISSSDKRTADHHVRCAHFNLRC
jgi:WD40 repeat protein